MATENGSGGAWGWGLAGALVGAVGVGLVVGLSAEQEAEGLRRELGTQGERLRALHAVYLREKKVSREELGALWSAPTWLRTNATSMARTEFEPVRHFLDGSSAAYEADTGRLVAVYDDPKRGTYFVPQNRGTR